MPRQQTRGPACEGRDQPHPRSAAGRRQWPGIPDTGGSGEVQRDVMSRSESWSCAVVWSCLVVRESFSGAAGCLTRTNRKGLSGAWQLSCRVSHPCCRHAVHGVRYRNNTVSWTTTAPEHRPRPTPRQLTTASIVPPVPICASTTFPRVSRRPPTPRPRERCREAGRPDHGNFRAARHRRVQKNHPIQIRRRRT